MNHSAVPNTGEFSPPPLAVKWAKGMKATCRPGELLTPLEKMREWLGTRQGWTPMVEYRDIDCYLDPETGDLGPYVRWALVLDVLDEAWQRDPVRHGIRAHSLKDRRFFISWILGCAERYALRLDQRDAGGERNRHGRPSEEVSEFSEIDFDSPAFKTLCEQFEKIFVNNKDVWRAAPRFYKPPFHAQLLAKLNRILRSRYAEVTADEMLHVRALSQAGTLDGGVLDRFKAWIQDGMLKPVDDLSELVPEYLLLESQKDPREKQLREVVKAIKGQDPRRPFLNVHAVGTLTGLRAFATTLLTQLRAPRAGLHQAPALIYIRLSRMDDGEQAPTRAMVIEKIERAFGITHTSSKRGIHSPIDLHADLLASRKALSAHAAILVLDAFDNAGGPFAPLFDVIRNAEWDAFLRVLGQPLADGLHSGAPDYPSRFVVLSSRPVEALAPWTCYSGQLPPPKSLEAIRILMTQPDAYGAELAGQRNILRITDKRRSGLAQLYPLADPFDAYFPAGGPFLPAECDMAIASLLRPGDIDRISRDAGLASKPQVERRHAIFWYWAGREFVEYPLSQPVLTMIAASVNGMRLTTLRRCLVCLAEMVQSTREGVLEDEALRALASFGLAPRKAQEEMITRLAERWRPIITNGMDEFVESLDVRQHWTELQLGPDFHADADEPDRRHLDFRHDEVRVLLDHHAIVASDRLDARSGALWEHVHQVLAEEALRQATVQVRHLHARDLSNPYVHRRFVQAIYHGLMSWRYDEDEQGNEASPARLPYFAMPGQPYRRFRYLYVFLYRRCVEDAPTWLLGRAFGRPQLKLVLLFLFADPHWVRRVLRDAWKGEAVAAVSITSAPGPLGPESILRTRRWIFRDSNLHFDASKALGRAAYETGTYGLIEELLAKVAIESPPPPAPQVLEFPVDNKHAQGEDWLLHGLSRLEVQIESLRQKAKTRQEFDSFAFAFAKLRIDARQAKGETAGAADLCTEWLNTLDFPTRDLRTFGDRLLDEPARKWRAGDRQLIEERIKQATLDWLESTPSSGKRIAVADLLFRLGEALATDADAKPADLSGLRSFLNAYAVYGIADQIRTGESGDEDGLKWQLVSSRPMRYYVRVTLKLSKLLVSPGAGDPLHHADAAAFFGQAKVRIDVHARHLYRLPKERIGMLLLQAAANRVWWEVEQAVIGPAADARLLDLAFDYVQDAEKLAFEIGFPAQVAYRLLLERSKTFQRVAQAVAIGCWPGKASTDVFCGKAMRDLETLEVLSKGSAFWTRLVERQREAVRRIQRFKVQGVLFPQANR